MILLAHGSGNDEDERFWIEQLEKRAEFIRKKAPAKFKAVKVATVREDWPEKLEWIRLSEAGCDFLNN